MPLRSASYVSSIAFLRRFVLPLALLASGATQAHAAEPPNVKEEPEKKTLLEKIPIRASGIIKPELVYSTGVETFGKATLVAPTAAAHPLVQPKADEWRSSFQLQQSRFSLHVGEGTPLTGHVEIDFVDPAFSKSSPIQAASPRLRLAYLTYEFSPGHTLMAGQNWDIFSPLNPTMMNMVGVAYQAGNSAFLRPQFSYNYAGKAVEVAGAIGMQRQNTGPAFNSVEYALIPSFALRVSHRAGKMWFGVSGIGSAQETVEAPNKEYEPTFAANLFASLPIGSSVTIKAEGYFGKNTGALGLLTLGTSAGPEVMDAGGYLSATLKLAERHSLWLTAAMAAVLNTDDLARGYALTVDSTDPAVPVTTGATRVGAGGIERNGQARATYVFTPLKGLELYVEPYLFFTRHKIEALPGEAPLPADLADESPDRLAFGSSFGSRFRF